MRVNSPIGIFDSGVGGLTVAKEISKTLPRESIAYVGDEIHMPYGERSPEEIRSFALGITHFLVERGVKMVVMACNMSSAVALEPASKLFPHIPVLGVIEAGVRAAVRETPNGRIGVLATQGTVGTRAYTRTIRRLIPDAQVLEAPCPRFVPLVEADMSNSREAEEASREYLEPLLSAGYRTIVLGCTHYPFLTDTIRRVTGPDITLIDPAEETALEAANALFDARLLDPAHIEPVHTYFTTARPEQFARLGARFTGRAIADVRKITWGVDIGAIEWLEKTAEQTTKSVR